MKSATWMDQPISRQCVKNTAKLSIVFFVCCFLATDVLAEPLGAMERGGSTIFAQYCSSCHGLGGKGNGPVASALSKRPADLTTIQKRRGGVFPARELAAIIDGRSAVGAHGSREMPVWGRTFSDNVGGGEVGEEVVSGKLAVLVEFLQSIQE